MQGRRRIALELRHPGRVFAGVALAALVLDQASKIAVRAGIAPGASVPLIDGFFELTYVRNVGAAFGLFPGRQPVFIGVSVLVLFAVAAYWRRARPTEWPVVISLALIFGGSVGNLIDRAGAGKVTDFFYLSFIDFPVFNVADMAIVSGVGVLMAWLLFGPVPTRETSPELVLGEREADDDEDPSRESVES